MQTQEGAGNVAKVRLDIEMLKEVVGTATENGATIEVAAIATEDEAGTALIAGRRLLAKIME
jgi:hypothetical protein